VETGKERKRERKREKKRTIETDNKIKRDSLEQCALVLNSLEHGYFSY
jgi:hypothetical protein